MSQRSLPILVLLLAVLGGLAYWLASEPEKEKKQSSQALLGPLGGPPTELHMVNGDRTKEYRFREGSLGWELVHPVEDEASEAYMVMLLGQLGRAEKTDAFPDGEPTPKEIAEAGLKEPKGTLVCRRDGKEVKIEFGEECYPPGKAFARVDGEIFKIPKGIESCVDQNRDDLRNPMLFRTSGPAVQVLEVRKRGDGDEESSIRIRREGSGFRVSREKGAEEFAADPVAVTSLLRGVLAVRARRFFPPDQVTGPQRTWLTLRVVGNFGEEVVTLTDPGAGIVYADKRGRNVKLEVESAGFVGLVEQSVDTLLNMNVWTFGPATASKIRIEVNDAGSQRVVAFERTTEGNKVRLVAPSSRYTNPETTNTLLMALEKTRFAKLLKGDARDPARKALETPAVVLKLEPPHGRSSLPKIEVALARGANGQIWGRRNEETSVWEVACPSYDDLLRPWWDFAEQVAFRFSGRRPVLQIAITHAGKTRSYSQNDKGVWQLGDEALPEDDEFDFAELFDELKVVSADRVIGGPDILEGREKLATFHALGNHSAEPKPFSLGRFELYSGPGKRLWGRTAEDPVLFRLRSRPTRVFRGFLAWSEGG